MNPGQKPSTRQIPSEKPISGKIRLQYKYWFYSVLNPKAKPQLGLTSYLPIQSEVNSVVDPMHASSHIRMHVSLLVVFRTHFWVYKY